MRRLALLALLAFAAVPARADDAADARRAKIEAAKRADAEDQRGVQGARQRMRSTPASRGCGRSRSRRATSPPTATTSPPNTYQPLDLGVNALVLLTLAKSGVPADDKVVDRLKGWCFANYANMKGLKKVMVYLRRSF